jgi:hypothetical protein
VLETVLVIGSVIDLGSLKLISIQSPIQLLIIRFNKVITSFNHAKSKATS